MAPETPQGSAALTPYAALLRILDIHYQATSHRFPEGECAVCCTYSSAEQTIIGVRYPCPTRQVAEGAMVPNG